MDGAERLELPRGCYAYCIQSTASYQLDDAPLKLGCLSEFRTPNYWSRASRDTVSPIGINMAAQKRFELLSTWLTAKGIPSYATEQ